MAGVSTSIQLNDRMTPVLQSITNSMNIMLNSFHAAQRATGTAFETAAMAEAQREIASASAELARYQEGLERASRTPPPEPRWEPVSTPQVFMNTGIERFTAEMQSANQMAQQLHRTQQQISAQARGMNVTPPGMLNDVAMVGNRVQSLANQIEGLNQMPVDLQTGQTNRELEKLRWNLSQALETQEGLNQAIGKMDFSAANAAYKRLNSIIDSTEQGIRDNILVQGQFNQSLGSGASNAAGLEQTVKRVVAAAASVVSAGKIIGLADEVAQTTARLDLMNQQFGETGDLQQKIYESAQRSRGAYQATADAVSRLGMQARGAFANTDEVVAFAEQLNKTFAIAGTSAQGVDSVMLQLTQSMAAGRLQGEELNAVLDNAQPIVQNIADYMGVPVGQIKQLASEGAITAEVIKNAMFAAADETNAKFGQMPMTFSQVATNIRSQALMAFQPALQQLSAIAQTPEFQSLVSGITTGIQMLAQAAAHGLGLMAQAAVWTQENWWWLIPVIGAVMTAVLAYKGAVVAYNAVQGVSNALKGAAAIVAAAHAAATVGEAAATTAATGVQWSFNAALLACPLTWIVLAIIAVVAVIAIWINHIGGLRAAWQACVDAVLTVGDRLKLGIMFVGMTVQNTLENMQYAFSAVKVGILNALGLMKVGGLMIVESFLNGVIDRINRLIEFVNNIPGVSIQALGKVELVAGAAAEEQVKIQQRSSDLATMKAENSAAQKARQEDYMWQKLQADAAKDQRDWERRRLQDRNGSHAADDAAINGYSPAAMAYEDLAGGIGDIGANTGNTAGNTASMADSMDMAEEDLKSMRDLAEQEVINRFTTAELTVNMGGITNQVNSQMDLDGINSYLEESIFEVLETAAEGVY